MTPPLLAARPDPAALATLLETMTVTEIAEACGVDASTVYRWMQRAGVAPPQKPGGRRRVALYLSCGELAAVDAAAAEAGTTRGELMRARIMAPWAP